MQLIVSEADGVLSVEMTCGETELAMPSFLVEVELAFLANLLRTATREKIVAVRAQMQEPPEGGFFSAFLGCEVEAAPRNVLGFRSEDMDVPFASHNDAMWSYFEPERVAPPARADVRPRVGTPATSPSSAPRRRGRRRPPRRRRPLPRARRARRSRLSPP
jgi:hypothetical protein